MTRQQYLEAKPSRDSRMLITANGDAISGTGRSEFRTPARISKIQTRRLIGQRQAE